MADLSVPLVDFSRFADPFDGFMSGRKARRDQDITEARRSAVVVGPDGKVDMQATGVNLLKAGDREGFTSLATLASKSVPEGYRAASGGSLEAIPGGPADPSVMARKRDVATEVEPGFRRTATGGLEPIPGGSKDPSYLKSANEAKEKPRQFSVTDITKLSEEGGKFANLTGFVNTFEDRFAGYKVPGVGAAAMALGRYAPAVVGKDQEDGAAWWQGYDRFKNVVRNDLFGSALTAPEQAAFEKADIGPGMDPAQIRKNLALQQQIVSNGLKRKANAMISSGYDPKAISEAYGVPLDQIGVESTGRSRQPSAVSPAASGAPAAATRTIAPPVEAVNSLKTDPSPSRRAKFDEVFGAGMAARVLGR